MFHRGLPRCFWPWPLSSKAGLSDSLVQALISPVQARVSECPREALIKGPILTSARWKLSGCLECMWRSRQTALGCFYPQTRPRAASWLTAKWRIKHLCVEDQKGTGRKKFKCMRLLEEHYPHQHLVSLNNAYFSRYFIPVRKTHLHVISVLGWQIILCSWVVSPPKQLKKACNLFLFL